MRKPPPLALASILCSTPSVILAILAFMRYWFGNFDESRMAGEDVLGLGIVSLWVMPLLVAGFGLGLFARGYRLICAGVAAVPLLCWVVILFWEGSFL
jgi:hypothetical protein